MAKEIALLVGPPGCGKSTTAKKVAGRTYINQDSQGQKGHLDLFTEAIKRGDSIVVDRMNFSIEQRKRYLEPAIKAGYTASITVFETPRQICLDRCIARQGHETIKDATTANKSLNFFFSHYEKPLSTEANVVKFIQEPLEKTQAIVVDLDGTIADASHRMHYVKCEGKKNWGGFFKGIENDEVNEPVAEIVRHFAGDYEIVYCSGRPEDQCREATEKWLKKNGLWYQHLYMRSTSDYRSDDIAKEILLDYELLPRFIPLFFLDDRDRVVSLWRRRGFTCLQVAPGAF